MRQAGSNDKLDGIGDVGADIRHLFSYNLQRLALISSRIASRHTLDRFGLTLQEWRALAVLDFLKDAPLLLLAQRAGIQKSQASRLISDIEKRGFIVRTSHPSDKRSTLLSLTKEGKALADQVLEQTRLRNFRMLDGLTDAERCELMRLVGVVIGSSKSYLDEIKRENGLSFESKAEPASFFED